MKYTLTINQLDEHTKALINLIKATNNVSLDVVDEDIVLSNEQKNILDERYEKHLNGESKSSLWQDVKGKYERSK